jgi:hypothetical protein
LRVSRVASWARQMQAIFKSWVPTFWRKNFQPIEAICGVVIPREHQPRGKDLHLRDEPLVSRNLAARFLLSANLRQPPAQ